MNRAARECNSEGWRRRRMTSTVTLSSTVRMIVSATTAAEDVWSDTGLPER